MYWKRCPLPDIVIQFEQFSIWLVSDITSALLSTQPCATVYAHLFILGRFVAINRNDDLYTARKLTKDALFIS